MRYHRPMLSAVASRRAWSLVFLLFDPRFSIRNRHSTFANRQSPSSLRPSVPSSLPFRRFSVSLGGFVPSTKCHYMAVTKKPYSQNEPI